MKNDQETNQIIRTVKELFVKNIKNIRELSKFIDKYLIQQELEKKSNTEVSTPESIILNYTTLIFESSKLQSISDSVSISMT